MSSIITRINNRYKRYVYRKTYSTSISMAASICNKESFSEFKNINKGKKVALCGAGPTLKNYAMIDDCLHVALNRALLNKSIKYDWFIADDWDGIDFLQNELLEFDGIIFFGHQIGDYSREIPESFRLKCGARRYYTDSYLVSNGFKSRFVCDIDKMPIGNMPNIAISAMQIMLYTNPDTIYLVGCDASSGHFIQPDQLSQERIQAHEKDLSIAVKGDKTIAKWMELKKFANAYYPDTKIVSINPVGLKGIFEDVYQEDK